MIFFAIKKVINPIAFIAIPAESSITAAQEDNLVRNPESSSNKTTI